MGLYGLKCGDFMRQVWRFYESNDTHPLFSGTLAAVIRGRREARYAPYFPTILAGAPAETFHHHQPGPIDANPFALHQLAHLVDMRVGRGLQLGATLRFHLRN